MKEFSRPREDPDEVLTRVVRAIERKDFFQSILVNDTFEDWELAREFGEFLTRIEPQEIMGHALLARAYRHLGEPERALMELKRCRAGVPHPSERKLFSAFLIEEEKHSSKRPSSGKE